MSTDAGGPGMRGGGSGRVRPLGGTADADVVVPGATDAVAAIADAVGPPDGHGGGTAAEPVLALRGVTRRYGKREALRGVDLDVAEGQVLALLGPNGAGKTTLVGVAAGLTKPDGGTARVVGVDPHRDRRTARRAIGLAPQEIGLYPPLTVRQNLRAFGEAQGLRAKAARVRADELLAPFGLEELADRAAGQLSGGEKRRAHAAAALVARPRLVLLDEPTAGADPRTRGAILDVVRGVAAEGAAVVYTTHYLPEVEQLGADVALLEDGRIIAHDPLDALIGRHAEPTLLLTFDGPVPASVAARDDAVVEEEHVRITAAEPATALRHVIAGLTDDDAPLANAEIVRPSLEAAYLALTGRRSAGEETA